MVAGLIFVALLVVVFGGGARLGYEYGKKQRLRLGTPHQEEIPQEIAGVVLPAYDDPRWHWSSPQRRPLCSFRTDHSHLRLGSSSVEACTHDGKVLIDDVRVDRRNEHLDDEVAYVEAVRTAVVGARMLEAIKEAP